jgi:hypothetical protein
VSGAAAAAVASTVCARGWLEGIAASPSGGDGAAVSAAAAGGAKGFTSACAGFGFPVKKEKKPDFFGGAEEG